MKKILHFFSFKYSINLKGFFTVSSLTEINIPPVSKVENISKLNCQNILDLSRVFII